MYTALLECVTTPGQDGMRFALFLIKFSVLERPRQAGQAVDA